MIHVDMFMTLLTCLFPKVYRLITLLMDHKEDLDDAAKKHRQKVVDFIRKTLKLAQVLRTKDFNVEMLLQLRTIVFVIF